MTLTKQGAFSKKVTDLSNTPSPNVTPADIKSYFQTPSDELAETHNALVDDLTANTAAGLLGAKDSTGATSNVQEELDNLNTNKATTANLTSATNRISTNETDITNLKNNKTDKTGDHLGTWHGFTPSQADPGISSVVDSHTAQLADIVDVVGESIENFPLIIPEINDTERFRRAASTGKIIMVPNKGIDYTISGVIKLTNSIFGVGFPKIKMATSVNSQSGTMDESASYQMFRIINETSKIIEIAGIHLDGSYDGTGTITEHSHLISVSATDNVYIHHNILENPYGDCVYIGKYTWEAENPAIQDVCKNIHIYKNIIKNPRRCNVAIVSGENIRIKDNEIIKSHVYVASLDLEPNIGDGTYVKNVKIENNNFNYSGYIINFYPTVDSNVQNITIRSNKFQVTQSGVFLSGTNGGVSTDITIDNNEFNGTGKAIETVNVISGFVARNIDIKNNDDFITNIDGWLLQKIRDMEITNNKIYPSGNRGTGIVILDCSYVTLTENKTKNVYSIYGAFRIVGSVVQQGLIVTDNTILGAQRGIEIDKSSTAASFNLKHSYIGGNIIDADSIGIEITNNVIANNVVFGKQTFIGVGQYSGSGNLDIVNDLQVVNRKLYYKSALPSNGNYGDVVINTGKSRTKNIDSWFCETAGTPGSWRASGFGYGTTAERPTLTTNDKGYAYKDTTTGTTVIWDGASWI